MKRKKINAKTVAYDAFALVISSFLSAAALHSFIIPNNFVSGGVGGISVILENAGIIKSYLSYYIMNIPLLIAALIKLRKDFAVKTILSATLISVIMGLMEALDFFRFTDDRLLAAVYSGVLFGISLGIVYEIGGSTGGSEIIANLIVKRHPTAKISRLIMLMDIIIIGAGLIIFDGWSVVYALVCALLCERAMAVYIDKGRTGGMYYIVTGEPDSVRTALGSRFGREGIMMQAKGAVSDDPKALIKLFLPDGNQNRFKQVIENADKQAFCFVATAQISAKGNKIEDQP